MVRLSILLVGIVLVTGCASTGAVPRPFPLPGGAHPPASPAGEGAAAAVMAPSTDGYSISSTALSLRGAPYRNGGADPGGFDCSGFVSYVFAQHGLRMPREVRKQYEVGKDVTTAALAPGDLVFFTTVAPGASHVGIIVGGDQFVHAPSTNGVVRVEHLSTRYWADRFLGAKRVN
ncbi:MAG TPA: C40 family peptidase [Vicinamibacterales bacterium]|nr:C40 family peptidase [Vicinamibacterales bacterium]